MRVLRPRTFDQEAPKTSYTYNKRSGRLLEEAALASFALQRVWLDQECTELGMR